MCRRSGRPTISTEARLKILLLMMAGSDVWDCMSTFQLSTSTIYHVFHHTKRVINDTLDLPGLPNSYSGLENLSNYFQ